MNKAFKVLICHEKHALLSINSYTESVDNGLVGKTNTCLETGQTEYKYRLEIGKYEQYKLIREENTNKV